MRYPMLELLGAVQLETENQSIQAAFVDDYTVPPDGLSLT